VDARNERLAEILNAESVDAVMFTKQANQRYLESFTGGDCFLLASGAANFLIADSRYVEMARSECRGATVLPHRFPHPPLGEVAAGVARERGWRRISFEGDHISWGLHGELAVALSEAGVDFAPLTPRAEALRARKDADEIAWVSEACRVADAALEELLPLLRPGVSELEMSVELDYRMKRAGAEDVSFDTMVLFGARASQPHATPRQDVILMHGDFILSDFGAVRGGYRSDTTRTFVCGAVADEQRRAYDAVLRAQLACVDMIGPGVNGSEISARAADIIRDAGFPPFEHGIGHGVGLEIHEPPFLRHNTDTILEPGMIVTIEPGTYIPGWGGIRIEDTVLVTDDGRKVLTRFTKDLIEL
jgi:Xaa-Pro aminopeptidase